jgi:hypothetical protein
MTEPIPGKSDITGPKIGPQERQEIPDQAPSGKEFGALMEQGEGIVSPESGEQVSPMELGQVAQPQEVTPQTLQEGIQRIGDKTQTLQSIITPERFDELSPGQKSLLHMKLTQFSEHVKGLADQTGVPYQGEVPKGSAMQGLKTYIGWLTNGQATIQNVADQIGSSKPGSLSVADMLRAQAKLVAAERAINFASAVAGKGTDFIKQMMQTQI